jgi:hypothetical protein
MKFLPALLLFATRLTAHDGHGSEREAVWEHWLQEWKLTQASSVASGSADQKASAPSETTWKTEVTRTATTTSALAFAAAALTNAADAPLTAKAFLPFPKLDLRADDTFLYVGSNGMPDHPMMIGITAWQQQVPLPQSYFGENAWRLPLHPVPAAEPALIKGRFLRGAIALAVNGVPIFNPQNNRGEVSQEIGELDEWGGHCGRGDDYHYHAAPLHLQALVGRGMPIAYALDGYPIYGLTEPDGSAVGKLDACHGHETPGVGYHYHASLKYPYVLGGFYGRITELAGQVDPQPRASPVRPSTSPLRGAVINGFESINATTYKLSYSIGGEARSITYSIEADGSYPFEYDNGREGKISQVYTARRAAVGSPPASKGNPKGKAKGKAAAN